MRRLSASLSLLAILAIPTAAVAKKAPRGFFGVVTQEPLNGYDYANMQRGDVGTVRVAMSWASVQQVPGKCQAVVQVGVCSWTVMDEIVRRSARAGVRVLPMIAGSPPWAASDPRTAPLKGTDRRRWQGFLRAAAERYGRKGRLWKVYRGEDRPITDWQIWNEPNSKAGWTPRPNPRKYAKLVKISSQAIRTKDREADIVLGGMYPRSRLPLAPFMKRFYRVRRIERRFDVLAIHPYAPQVRQLRRQLGQARAVLRRGGDRRARIALTEMGWSLNAGEHPLMKGNKGQAALLRKSFRVLKNKRKRWKLSGVSWFALQDTSNALTCRFCSDSGLFKTNGAPKRSWGAFRRFSR